MGKADNGARAPGSGGREGAGCFEGLGLCVRWLQYFLCTWAARSRAPREPDEVRRRRRGRGGPGGGRADTPRRKRRRGRRHDAPGTGCLAGRAPKSCDLSMVLKAPSAQLRAPCAVRPAGCAILVPAYPLRQPAAPQSPQTPGHGSSGNPVRPEGRLEWLGQGQRQNQELATKGRPRPCVHGEPTSERSVLA